MEFTDLYVDQRRTLTGSLILAGSSPADAADYVAEAFARAWERWDRVGAMDRPDLWVTTVAINVARRSGRRRAMEAVLLRRTVSSELVPDGARVAAVWDAIRRLPPRQRTAVALRYYQGYTERECASAMGIRPGTIAATLSRARAALARSLGDGIIPAQTGAACCGQSTRLYRSEPS